MQLTHAMHSYFPSEVFEILKITGEQAFKLGLQVYLIGGSIRDLLLPQREFDWDIDLVVEHRGAEDLGRALQAQLGGQLQHFSQYGTAKLKLSQKLQLDIATARTEHYAYPGANPEVSFSDLHADLDRRDFSVNALAIALQPGSFGALIDYFDGYSDLQHRHLKALHKDKFREDPVRCWRACRLAHALDFRIEPQTLEWLHTTMKSGIFNGFFSARIQAELYKVLSFKDPIPCLLQLQELQILNCLEPELELDGFLLTALNRLENWQPWFTELHESWSAPLLLLLTKLTPATQLKLIPQLGLKQNHLQAWRTQQELGSSYFNIPWRKLKPSQIHAHFKSIPPLTLWLWLACYAESDLAFAIDLFWTKLRSIKPLISGNHLKEWISPGPQMRILLAVLLSAQLDGEIASAEAALNLAQKWIHQNKEVL
jgi:tRNA nucleotidyltransferase (CCA-adding enzyme)